jgi:hypothetical protein
MTAGSCRVVCAKRLIICLALLSSTLDIGL